MKSRRAVRPRWTEKQWKEEVREIRALGCWGVGEWGSLRTRTADGESCKAQASAGNNLTTTSASQPSANSCSGGARGSDAGDRQPAINRSNLSPIVTEVLEFGRIPQQIKRPTTKEDHDENNLANRLSKKKKSLSDVDKRQLELLKENAEQADAEAMAEPEAGANAVLEALPNE